MANKKRKGGNRPKNKGAGQKGGGQKGGGQKGGGQQKPQREAERPDTRGPVEASASGERKQQTTKPGGQGQGGGKKDQPSRPSGKPGQNRRLSGSARRAAQRRAAKRKRQMMTFGIPVVIVIAIVVVVLALGGGPQGGGKVASAGSIKVTGASLPTPSAANPTPAIGKLVPSFSAPGLNGGTISWAPGKPTVLTVWAAWCPHCQVELPKLNSMQSQYPGVQFLSINTAQGKQPGPVPADFIKSKGITIPVAIDNSAQTLLQAMGVDSFPTLYFINADGTVLDQMAGEPADVTLQKDFQKLQQQAGTTPASPAPSPTK